MDAFVAIAAQFTIQGQVIDLQEFGNGNINRTFLVTLEDGEDERFVLQCINTQVFPQPELVMQNLRRFSDHARQRLQYDPLQPNRRWEVPRVLLTQDGQDCWIDGDGGFWRAISFIEGAQSFDTIQNAVHAQEIGLALGTFHKLLSDLPADKLADTLEGFHITPRYLQNYQAVLAKHLASTASPASAELAYCLQFVRDRAPWATVLEQAKAEGKLQLRPIHGDPKINNILIDRHSSQAISLIDLDTVKPGLVHYDIGDCLRSGCNPLGEETEQWQSVRFESDLCEAILEGYLSTASVFLTAYDYDYLYDAIRLIAFELGLRFLTDYLAGNVYFKTRHPEHNLARALVQFKLTESIEAQAETIRAMIGAIAS